MELLKGMFYQPKKNMKEITAPPPEKGIKRYFFVAGTHFWLLMRLNLLFVLFCLPVVTIPASISALTRVSLNLTREGITFLWSDFFKEFKLSFAKSWILGGIWVLFGLIGYLAYAPMLHDVYANLDKMIVGIVIFAFLYIYSCYFFSMLALIDLPVGIIMKNSLLMVILEMRRNILLILLPFLICVAIVMFLPYTIPVILLLGFSFASLMVSVITIEPIKKRVIKQTNESELL
jgi:Predicted integral membrane protein